MLPPGTDASQLRPYIKTSFRGTTQSHFQGKTKWIFHAVKIQHPPSPSLVRNYGENGVSKILWRVLRRVHRTQGLFHVMKFRFKEQTEVHERVVLY